jgi:hypothetical protein
MSEKYFMQWDEFYYRLIEIQTYWNETLSYFVQDRPIRVYGIPCSGMIVAGFCDGWKVVNTPNTADILIDDIIDGGSTKAKYANKYFLNDEITPVPFVAIVDKINSPIDKNLGYVVFPWQLDKEEKTDYDDHIARILQLQNREVSKDSINWLKGKVQDILNFDDR